MTDETFDTTGPEEWAGWRSRIAASRRRRDNASGDWQENVRRRAGRVATDSGPARLSINRDWPLTKAKIGLLYSQTPQVRLTTGNPQLSGPLSVFSTTLNKTITASAVGSCIEEELADVVNAAGISAVHISCEKRTEMRDMPVMTPDMLPPEMQIAVSLGEAQIPTMPVQAVTDVMYPARRVSPAALLVPADFIGSQYDFARWLGYEGVLTWAQGVVNLGLTEEHKSKVLGPDYRASNTSGTLNGDTNKFRDTDVVNFQELYYWRHYYHEDETDFHALQRLVFVDGLPEPVINEPYQGQRRMEDGRIVGVRRNPIQVLTLTYISDDCLPPSDSSISRHQVNELEDSRDAMVKQRKHSIPIRWYDTNRVSPGTRTLVESGTYQGLIPVNGPGERALGVVAQAAFPPERFEFDAVINNDINEQWALGQNQAGAFASGGTRTATEARVIQNNFQTRIGQERSKVERHFVAIAEIIAALIAMHGNDVPPEALLDVNFAIRVDSTVLLDGQQRIDQLMRFLNMTVQSGFVNPKPVIEEIAELSGLDPSKVVIDPQPKAPEPINVSIGGPEDISNPVFLAALMHTNQGPTPDDLKAAIELLKAAALFSPAPILAPLDQGDRPQSMQPALPPPQGPQGGLPPEIGAPPMAFPNWESAPRVDRRSEDGGA